MDFDFEWEDAPGLRDDALAATWARLSLRIGARPLSELVDLRSQSRRTGIYGSLLPLAEWLVEHWWSLLHEPAPQSSFGGARRAPRWMHDWVLRHNLLAARDGGALPDLTIARDGAELAYWLAPDPWPEQPARVRFVGQGEFRSKPSAFRRAAGALVESVLDRLEAQVPEAPALTQLREAWGAIGSADSEERRLCRALAVLGVDPYDPDEATEPLITAVERAAACHPAVLADDLFEGSTPEALAEDSLWVERASAGLRRDGSLSGGPTFPRLGALPAHEEGYRAARWLRSEVLQASAESPLPDLEARLAQDLGWAPVATRAAPGGPRVEGLLGQDAAGEGAVLVVPDQRRAPGERFRLARAAYFHVVEGQRAPRRLLTTASTRPQRAARAFAAELLAPAEGLARRASGRLGEREVERLAEEFLVDSSVVRHQVENHGIGVVEA